MIYEYNVWYFVKAEDQGIISAQFATRHYGKKELEHFLQNTMYNKEYMNSRLDYLSKLPINQYSL